MTQAGTEPAGQPVVGGGGGVSLSVQTLPLGMLFNVHELPPATLTTGSAVGGIVPVTQETFIGYDNPLTSAAGVLLTTTLATLTAEIILQSKIGRAHV